MTTRLQEPTLRFDWSESSDAFRAWGFNCGPAALAAILGMTPAEVRGYLPERWPGYTTAAMMVPALERVCAERQWRWRADVVTPENRLRFPFYGLARIQWGGPWMAANAKEKWKYCYTHWVASMHWVNPGLGNEEDEGSFDANRDLWVYDVNQGQWCSAAQWCGMTAPAIMREVKRCDGKWFITDRLELDDSPPVVKPPRATRQAARKAG
jgi:hypothetical protein